jgi:AraC-like DNA-binding protein
MVAETGRVEPHLVHQATHAPGDFDFAPVPLLEHRPYDRIRELYLYEEPTLLAAIGRGDRAEAIRIINYVLVHIYAAGQERSDLLKGLLLELVVMMSRAAVEAGSSQSEVLGHNFRCLTELADIDDDERLAHWLRSMVERIFDAIERQEDFTPPLLVTRALRFMRENLHRDVSRDETAQHAGISPSHFSRLLRERTGRSFTELLRQARVELASELLVTTDDPLVVVAGRCGFCDQAYFTRVFQRSRHVTPRQFRMANRPSGSRPMPRPGELPWTRVVVLEEPLVEIEHARTKESDGSTRVGPVSSRNLAAWTRSTARRTGPPAEMTKSLMR